MFGSGFEIGDRVIIDIPLENWQWGYHPVSKQLGVEAVVTGFSEIAYTRVQNYGKPPGIYVNHSWVYVKPCEHGSGDPIAITSYFLRPVDEAKYKARLKTESRDIRLRDLPETKFWEDDVVRCTFSASWAEMPLRIRSIEYADLERKRNDGSPMPEYTITPIESGHGYMPVNETDLTLVRRGNVYAYYHQQPLVFNDIRDEADFWDRLGHTKEIPNPSTGRYSWTKDEILHAVQDGTVHGFNLGYGMFGIDSEPTNRGMVFCDAEVGERVRQATLVGFGLPDLKNKNDDK